VIPEYVVQKMAENGGMEGTPKKCVTAQNCTAGKDRFQLTSLPYDHSSRFHRNCPRRDSNTRETADMKAVTDRGDFSLVGMASTWRSSCQLAGPNVATFHVLFLCREKVSNLSDI
jgi:hypothetical protein